MIEKYADHPDIGIFCLCNMMQVNQSHILKALTSYIIEKSLLDVVEGSVILHIVSNEIFKKHQCYIPDCYENPEYLNTVLDDISRTLRHKVNTNITNQLREFSYNKEIQKFLKKLNYGLNIDLHIATIA